MKQTISLLIAIFTIAVSSYSQGIIADWESSVNPTLASYPEGNNPVRVANPSKEGINTSDYVQRLITLSDNDYELVYTSPPLTEYIDFTGVNGISLKVMSDVNGYVNMKISSSAFPATPKEESRYYFSGGYWQEMEFYFPGAQSDTFNIIAIFPDYCGGARSDTFYIDDIRTIQIDADTLISKDTIADFDNYSLYFQAWGTSDPEITYNPLEPAPNNINSSARCLKFISSASYDEGMKHVFNSPLDFSSKNAISVMVYSPDNIGIFELRLEDPGDTTISRQYQYTTPGVWQKLTFDLTEVPDRSFSLMAIVPGIEDVTPGIEWYIDEITFTEETFGKLESSVIADFDNYKRIFQNHGGTGGLSVVQNPDNTGLNSSENVLQVQTVSGSQEEFFNTTLERRLDFEDANTMSMMVYSQVSGTVRLRLIGWGVEAMDDAQVYTATNPPTWQKLVFDMNRAQDSAYNYIQIFPDFGSTGEDIWYFDELKTENIPFDGDTIVNFDTYAHQEFDDWGSTGGFTVTGNPEKEAANPSDSVLQVLTASIPDEGIKITRLLGFAEKNAISINVFSDTIGIVQLSLEGDNVESVKLNYQYTSQGHWQKLTFDLRNARLHPQAYNIIAIRPDFGGTAAGQSWYFDDFVLDSADISPFSGTVLANFDDVQRIFYQWDTRGISLDTDPLNSGNHALKILTSGSLYEGVKDVRERNLDFSQKNVISMNVLSDILGVVHLKLQKSDNPVIVAEEEQYQYTTPGEWQTLTFDLSEAETDIYDLVAIFPDFDNNDNGTWYIDDILLDSVPVLPFASDTIANFDEKKRKFFQWEPYTGLEYVQDPLDTNNHVLKTYTTSAVDSVEGFKTELERNLDFSKTKKTSVNIRVLSASTGTVRLNLEGDNVSQYSNTAEYTTANQWQVLSWDVSGLNTNAYNRVAIMPDNKNTTDGVAWYFDDIVLARDYDLNMYSDWEEVTKTFVPVGNALLTAPADNPAASAVNPSAHVMEVTVTSADEGAIADLGQYIDFSVSAGFPLKVLSATTGNIRLQLTGTNVTSQSVELPYTLAGEWQELLFEFDPEITTDVYDEISILPAAGTWYIDDLMGPGLVPVPETLHRVYADWDSVSPVLSKTWGGIVCTPDVANPMETGINQSAGVMQVITSPSPDSLWEGFAIDAPEGVFNFSSGSSFALNVYSADAGRVLFKLENSAFPQLEFVQQFADYSKTGSWQQLVFTFDSSWSDKLNRMAVFPDFGDSTSTAWYFDNIQGPGYISKALINENPGGIGEGREDDRVITSYIMGETLKSPLNPAHVTIAGLPSGVSVGSVTRIDDVTVNIVLDGNSAGHSYSDIPLVVTIDKDALTGGTEDLSAGGIYITATGGFTDNRDKKVFVHFMPWFNTEDAVSGVPAYCGWRNIDQENPDTSDRIYSNEPLIGEYSLLDEDVLEYQLLSMYAAGIDGLIIDLNPSKTREKIMTMSLLDKLMEMNALYEDQGFHLEFMMAYDEKDENASVDEGLEYFRGYLINNQDFRSFRFEDDKTGFPVITTWASFNVPLFHQCLDSLYNDSILHMALSDTYFESSDANFEWVNYLDTINSPSGNNYYWGENYYDNFEYTMARQDSIGIPVNDRNYLYMSTVWPGFDDHNAPWNGGNPRWIDRDVTAGETMALTFDRQISYSARRDTGYIGPVKVEMPWIQIATWNDWSEGTSIEPASATYYGYDALRTTAVKTAEFKDTVTPDTSRLRIPYAIYQARKDGSTASAMCLIDRLLAGSSYNAAVSACGSGYYRYIPMPAYSAMENENYSGAACIKMILDLEGPNDLTQDDIQVEAVDLNYYTNRNQDFIDPYGMSRALNYFGLLGYHYGAVTETSQPDAEKDICYWISNIIPNVNQPHMPSVVPTDGNYNNWMIVNGFRSDVNPQDVGIHGSFTIYGFYVKDPNVNGIGQDIYIQSSVFGEDYFKPVVSSDIWSGKYVTVDEPPVNNVSAVIQPLQPFKVKPVNNHLRFLAAEEGLKNYQLINNDDHVADAMHNAKRGRIYFVDVEGESDDYYIVTFGKNGGCVLAVTIDAGNGGLKEVSFAGIPDDTYYDHLEKKRTGFKSVDNKSAVNNVFYPVTGDIVTMTEDDRVEEMNGYFDFILSPNPAEDHINIIVDSHLQGTVYVDIYSITGQLADHFEIPDFTREVNYPVKTQHLEKGVYMVSMMLNGERRIKKLIIE